MTTQFLILSVLKNTALYSELTYTYPRTLSEGQIHVVMSLLLFIFIESFWVKSLGIRVILRVMMKCHDRDNRLNSLLQNDIRARYLVVVVTFTN